MAEHKRSTANGNPPITRHPLFPAIVALWLGALFGLGSIAIPPAAIEHFVTTAQIDRFIPMAAPPLGTTARILIALGMTGLGAVLGVLLGLRLARPAGQVLTRRRSVSSTEAAPSARRRPAPRHAPLDVEPAKPAATDIPATAEPGAQSKRGAKIFNVAALDPTASGDAAEEVVDPAPTDEIARSDTAPFAAPAASDGQVFAGDMAAPMRPAGNSLFETYSRGIGAHPVVEPEGPDPVFTADPETVKAHQDRPEPTTHAEAPVASDEAAQESPAMHEAVSPAFAPAANETPSFAAQASRLGHQAAERIISAELDDLSHLELLERLALAMERCRVATRSMGLAGNVAAEAACEEHVPPSVEEAAAEPEPEVHAPIAAPAIAPVAVETNMSEPATALDLPRFVSPVVPAALRPVALGAVEEDTLDDPLPGYVPPRHIGQASALAASMSVAPVQAAEEAVADDDIEEEEEIEEDADHLPEDGYSSLLNLSRTGVTRSSAQHWFGDEEAAGSEDMAERDMGEHHDLESPGVLPHPDAHDVHEVASVARPFDGPAANPNPEETEKALRAALATLQRMSGAA